MEMQNNGGSGFAIASMVLGIVALVMSCCFYFISIPCAVVGVVLGAVSLAGQKPGKGMAIAGLITSALSILLFLIFSVVFAVLVAAFSTLAADLALFDPSITFTLDT